MKWAAAVLVLVACGGNAVAPHDAPTATDGTHAVDAAAPSDPTVDATADATIDATPASDAAVDAAADAMTDAPAGAVLQITPMSTDFGSVALLAHSATVPFTISNVGTTTAASLIVTITGADFVLSLTTCGHTLPNGSSCEIDLQFAPHSMGVKSGALTATAANAATVTSQLTGTGLSDGGAQITITPSTRNFGSVTTSQVSQAQAFTATNGGSIASAALVVVIGGTDPTQYTITSDTCSGVALAPLASCTVGVAFLPSTLGSKAAQLQIKSGGNATSAALAGSGIAPAPKLSIVPASHDFGGVGIGMTSAPFQLTISNTGTDVAVALALSISDAAFIQTATTCGSSLAAGASCTADVKFAPPFSGSFAATLRASASNALTASAALTGLGITDGGAVIATNPSFNDYGAVAVGQTASFTFFVVNNGGLTTSALALALTGADPGQFSLGTDTCTGAMLAFEQTCIVQLVFAPTSTGTKSAAITVTAQQGGTATVGVTGTGT